MPVDNNGNHDDKVVIDDSDDSNDSDDSGSTNDSGDSDCSSNDSCNDSDDSDSTNDSDSSRNNSNEATNKCDNIIDPELAEALRISIEDSTVQNNELNKLSDPSDKPPVISDTSGNNSLKNKIRFFEQLPLEQENTSTKSHNAINRVLQEIQEEYKRSNSINLDDLQELSDLPAPIKRNGLQSLLMDSQQDTPSITLGAHRVLITDKPGIPRTISSAIPPLGHDDDDDDEDNNDGTDDEEDTESDHDVTSTQKGKVDLDDENYYDNDNVALCPMCSTYVALDDITEHCMKVHAYNRVSQLKSASIAPKSALKKSLPRPPPPPPPPSSFSSSSPLFQTGSTKPVLSPLQLSSLPPLPSLPSLLSLNNNRTNDDDDDDDDSDDDVDGFDHCRCLKCGLIFPGDEVYKRHVCNGSGADVDNIPTHPKGEFECMVCAKRYITENLLGEHFMLSHNNFEDCVVLDEEIIYDGFPGFHTLHYIGMMYEISGKHMVSVINEEKRCNICFLSYKQKEQLYKPKVVIELDCYSSDSELTYKEDESGNNMDNPFSSCSDFNPFGASYFCRRKRPRVSLRDPVLINAYNKYREHEVLPVELSCCHNYLCYDCLRNSVTMTNSIVCPFCKADHTRVDLDYITYVEPGDVDTNRWVDWWSKHVDIFY